MKPRAGGYDGGLGIGWKGTWNHRFEGLIAVLEKAKKQAQDSGKHVKVNLCGVDVLVSDNGAKIGQNTWKYQFDAFGVTFIIHDNPKNTQQVRAVFRAEALMVNSFPALHRRVREFLSSLGLTVTKETLTRIDMQVMIDVPVVEFIRLFESGHVITKLRKGSIDFSVGQVLEKETLTLGSIKGVQICIYDKRVQMQRMDLLTGVLLVQHCIGVEWANSDSPITRVEVRLGRDALKCLGVNSVEDLLQREQGITDLITHDWFRLLEKRKVRGHENTAAIHPLWKRVRDLFAEYFTGDEVENVVWCKPEPVSCDPVALERQALGCLSKALGARFGKQSGSQSAVKLANGWANRNQNELLEKLNCFAENVRVKTGIELGGLTYDSTGYEADEKHELDYVQDIGRRKGEAFAEMFPPAASERQWRR